MFDTVLMIRILILGLYFLGIVLVLAINLPIRRMLNFGELMRRLGIGAVLMAGAYATVELHVVGAPLGLRMWLLLVALIWLNIGLAHSWVHNSEKQRMLDRHRIRQATQVRDELGQDGP